MILTVGQVVGPVYKLYRGVCEGDLQDVTTVCRMVCTAVQEILAHTSRFSLLAESTNCLQH
jgi:hypothetical protein